MGLLIYRNIPMSATIDKLYAVGIPKVFIRLPVL